MIYAAWQFYFPWLWKIISVALHSPVDSKIFAPCHFPLMLEKGQTVVTCTRLCSSVGAVCGYRLLHGSECDCYVAHLFTSRWEIIALSHSYTGGLVLSWRSSAIILSPVFMHSWGRTRRYQISAIVQPLWIAGSFLFLKKVCFLLDVRKIRYWCKPEVIGKVIPKLKTSKYQVRISQCN